MDSTEPSTKKQRKAGRPPSVVIPEKKIEAKDAAANGPDPMDTSSGRSLRSGKSTPQSPSNVSFRRRPRSPQNTDLEDDDVDDDVRDRGKGEVIGDDDEV